MSWFWQVARRRCQYVIHMDVDEYLMTQLDTEQQYSKTTTLQDSIDPAQRHGFDSVKYTWITMKSNGYLRRQPGFLTELFTQRSPLQGLKNGKTICNTDQPFDLGNVHSCCLRNGRRVPHFRRDEDSWEQLKVPTKRRDLPKLVHFRERS